MICSDRNWRRARAFAFRCRGKTFRIPVGARTIDCYGSAFTGADVEHLDGDGAMSLWVRRWGKGKAHDLYRSEDGIHFSLLATPELDVQPVQNTDVFHVPEVGLMCLGFAGNYRQDTSHKWGLMTSDDNGLNWTRSQSNISDIRASTPSLIYDSETRLLSNTITNAAGLLRTRPGHFAKPCRGCGFRLRSPTKLARIPSGRHRQHRHLRRRQRQRQRQRDWRHARYLVPIPAKLPIPGSWSPNIRHRTFQKLQMFQMFQNSHGPGEWHNNHSHRKERTHAPDTETYR